MISDFQTLCDHISDGIIVLDENLKIFMANNQAEQLIDITIGEELPSPSLILKIKNVRAENNQLPTGFTHQGKEGQLIDVIVLKENQHTFLVINDRSSIRSLATLHENIFEFLNHELRTPMQVFIGATQMSMEALADDEMEKTERLRLEDTAIKSGFRLISKLKRLLDLAELHGEKNIVSDERSSVPELVLKAVGNVHVKAWERDIEIQLEGLGKADTNIYGSTHWLTYALEECLKNAIEYSPAGSKITLQAQDAELYSTLIISNIRSTTSAPIDEFMPFSRGSKNSSQAEQGLGIGLSLVKRIIELHGGNIRWQETVNKSVNITLELPKGGPTIDQSLLDFQQAQIYAQDLTRLMRQANK